MGNQPERDTAIEDEIPWEEVCTEVTARLLKSAEYSGGKFACTLTEWGFLQRAVSPNLDQVIDLVRKAIEHQPYENDRGDLTHLLLRLDMWLTERSPALTYSQRLQLVQSVDQSATRTHKPLRFLRRALDVMKELGADVTARVNLGHFDGAVLEPREDIVLHSIIPTGPEFYGGFHRALPLEHYLKLRDKLAHPIEVSQMSLDLLQMQATLSDEPVQLDLDHFKLMPIHADDRDWIKRTDQPIHFEWTMKTQA